MMCINKIEELEENINKSKYKILFDPDIYKYSMYILIMLLLKHNKILFIIIWV